jgi:iron(III) transport system permease protein
MAENMGRAVVRGLRRHEHALFLGGAAVLIFVLAALPLVQVLGMISSAGPAGLSALGSLRTWSLFVRSLLLAGGVTVIALAIGVPLGVLIGRADVPLRRLLWLVHSFPMFLPPFLPALGWFHWFGREGLVGNETTASLLFSDMGFVLLLGATLAPVVTSLASLGVMGVDASLEESARVVARPFRVATRILLPAAAPAIALSAIIVFALALSEVGVPMFLRVDVYAAAVFARLGGVDFAPGEALALTLPLVPVVLGLLALERRFAGGRSFAVLGLRSATRTALPLGGWRMPAFVACAAGAAVSAAPIGALAVRARSSQGLFEWAREAPWNGLVAGAAAATGITFIGLVVGHGAARRLRGAAVLDTVCMLAFVTPAAVLGVGLMALWNRPIGQAVYGSLAILVVGYVARYAVVGVRVLGCAVAQSPVHLEEAAAASGAHFGRRLVRLVLPIHARGALFAWLLALVFCLRDLETVVLFYPPGREPLTVRIFTLEANGPPAVVAGLSLLHVAITGAALAAGALLLWRRRP